LVTESYSTVYRGLGAGCFWGLGKISGAVAPFVVSPIYYSLGAYIQYLFYAIIYIASMVGVATYPFDLTGKPLDVDY